MDNELLARIKAAVSDWASRSHNTGQIVIGMAAVDEGYEDAQEYDEEGERYLVDFAVRSVGYWLVAEVWVSDGVILGVNDLGNRACRSDRPPARARSSWIRYLRAGVRAPLALGRIRALYGGALDCPRARRRSYTPPRGTRRKAPPRHCSG